MSESPLERGLRSPTSPQVDISSYRIVQRRSPTRALMIGILAVTSMGNVVLPICFACDILGRRLTSGDEGRADMTRRPAGTPIRRTTGTGGR